MQKPALPGFALSAGMLWLLAGALYKLFEGSPNDLPEVVKDMSPLSGWETMRAAIIVELAVVGLVIAKPRIGWFFLAATFGVFLAVLFPLVQAGESSCGCFGSNVTIAPQTMMGIDGGLMLLIFISRPWRMSPDSGLGWAGYLPLLAVAVAAPWMKLTAPVLPTPQSGSNTGLVDSASGAANDTASDLANAAGALGVTAGDDSAAQPDAGNEGDVVLPVVPPSENIQEPGTAIETPVVVLPDPEPSAMPEFYELRHDTWTGKDLYETDLASFIDQSQGAIMPGSHVVLYRETCSVCREHLTQLWEEAQNDPTKWSGENQLVLIRVIELKDATEENLCTVLPEPHQRVSLPALKRGYGLKTPMSFDVDMNNMIQNVQDLSVH